MVGYTRQEAANIVTGNTIEASHFNNEFNQNQAAFDGTTGHSHDGGTGNAPQIDLTTSVTGTLPVSNGGSGVTTLTDGGVLLGAGTSAIEATTALTDGQLLIGSTGVNPVPATLTAGTGINITEGTGSITVDTSASIAKTYSADSGTATPAENSLTISGGNGIDTSGTGSDITVTAVDRSTRTSNLDFDDNELSKPELKDYAETLITDTSASNVWTIDFEDGNHHEITLTENITTISISNPPSTGRVGALVLYMTQDGTGGRTVTFPSNIKWSDSAVPTITTTASRTDIVTLITRDGGTIYAGAVMGQNFTGL
jgi:hypothetical protein